MLSSFIMNSMDTFNIVYLWTSMTRRDRNIFKLMSSIIIISVLITVTEQLGLNFIAVYIIDIIVIKIIYKRDFKNVAFELVLALLSVMLIQLMLSLIVNKFVDDYTIQGVIIESIILICVIISSKFNLLKNITFEKINNNIMIYFISTSSIYVIVLKFIWDYDNRIIENNLFIVAIILCALILSQFFTYLYVVKVIKEKEALKVTNEYNSVINEIVEEIKQRQHDFINYKNTIRGIVEVSEAKDVKSAIINYIKDEDVYDNKINELVYIDNVVIRSIIYRSMCRAKKYGVDFQYDIENSVLDNILTYHEISNVLNNLLNNAFEEVTKAECVEKNIKIRIFNKNKTSHLIIKNKVVNPNDINLNEMFTRGYSTKSISTRGYGLYNVQAIINSHRGIIKINMEFGEIIFDIYFNNSSG